MITGCFIWLSQVGRFAETESCIFNPAGESSCDIYILLALLSHQFWICGHDKSQLDVSWCSPCDVQHLVHITHGALCLASEICQRGGARQHECRMSPCRRLWCLMRESMWEAVMWLTPFNRTLLQEELRHRQLTVTLDLSLMWLLKLWSA